MTPRYHGDASTRPRSRRAAVAAPGKIIDFQEEAKRRAIADAVAAGECALCLVQRLIERYPIFFVEPEQRACHPSGECHPERSEGSASPAQEILCCAQDDMTDSDCNISELNDVSTSQEGRR